MPLCTFDLFTCFFLRSVHINPNIFDHLFVFFNGVSLPNFFLFLFSYFFNIGLLEYLTLTPLDLLTLPVHDLLYLVVDASRILELL